jgi:anti-sigma factor RsiW
MTCEAMGKRLNALLDGECPDVEAQRLHTHLEGCAACRAEYEQLAQVRRSADTWQVEGGDIWSELQAQLDVPDLSALLKELQALRSEVRALRAEVGMLRSQTAGKTPERREEARSPSPLLPYSPSTTREVHIV